MICAKKSRPSASRQPLCDTDGETANVKMIARNARKRIGNYAIFDALNV